MQKDIVQNENQQRQYIVQNENQQQKDMVQNENQHQKDMVQNGRLFFIEGAGGCGKIVSILKFHTYLGKTHLYNTLIRWILAGKPDPNQRHQGKSIALKKGSVISCASTGIAALLLIGGGTAHRMLHVSPDVDAKTKPKLEYQSADAQRLRKAEVIIIDVSNFKKKDNF